MVQIPVEQYPYEKEGLSKNWEDRYEKDPQNKSLRSVFGYPSAAEKCVGEHEEKNYESSPVEDIGYCLFSILNF